MSFFKKLFGSKENRTDGKDTETSSIPMTNAEVSWMTDIRRENLDICFATGFKPASSLPTDLGRQLRPAIEIAKRLNAIKAIVLWLMIPQENLSDERILSFVENNNLMDFLTESEKQILTVARDDEDARNAIGWKFENAWPLAWYFGYTAPDILGQMMSGEQMQEILTKYTCPLEENLAEWVEQQEIISEKLLSKKEDLFYCLHNAVRSAQMGGDTVPGGFDTIGNGGVIHERRHSLTWMLSEGIAWDDTDLST